MKNFDDITIDELFAKKKKICDSILLYRKEYYDYMNKNHNLQPAFPTTEEQFENELFEIDCCCNLNLINDYNDLKKAIHQKQINISIQNVERMF